MIFVVLLTFWRHFEPLCQEIILPAMQEGQIVEALSDTMFTPAVFVDELGATDTLLLPDGFE